jgi:tetratricopeptide (TPR) repeat protein
MTTKTLRGPSDRTLNRMIIGALVILVIGVPLIGAIYLFDRYVATPPSIVDQKAAELERAVRDAPNNLALRLRLAGAYSAAQRDDAAVAQFDEVLKAAASLKEEDALGFVKTAHLGRADALRHRGDLAAAIADYQFVVDVARDGEFAPVDVELQSAYYQLGAIAVTQDRPADAIPALQGALAINKADADTMLLLGQAYLQDGKADKAIEPLRKAIRFVPIGWCEPYSTLGDAYTTTGQAAEAAWAGAMAAFCRNDPGDVRPRLTDLISGPAAMDSLIGLGLIAEIQGDGPAAADWYRQALARDPNDFTAASGLSRVTSSESRTGPTPASAAPSRGPGGDS